MKRLTGLLGFIALLIMAAGCSDDSTSVSCGEGEFVQVGDVRACVYRQSVVVENGFRCPSEFPNLIENGGVGICAPANDLGDGILDQFEDVYRDRRPDEFECMIAQNCLPGEACVNQTCRASGGNNSSADAGNNSADASTSDMGTDPDMGDDTCMTDADCAEPEVCLDGRCIVLEMAPCTDNIDCAENENCVDSQCVLAADCGGFAGLQCDTGFWCDYPDSDQPCGIADGLGFCRPAPETCPTVIEPVCGCDGTTYDNQCEARLAGQDISSNMPCP